MDTQKFPAHVNIIPYPINIFSMLRYFMTCMEEIQSFKIII